MFSTAVLTLLAVDAASLAVFVASSTAEVSIVDAHPARKSTAEAMDAKKNLSHYNSLYKKVKGYAKN